MKKLSLAFALLLGGITNASAELTEYTLNNVTFDDGATASGSFTYDSDPPYLERNMQFFTNINITTQGGDFPGDSYTGSTAGYNNTNGFGGDFAFRGVGDHGGELLSFAIDGSMFDLANGGTFDLQISSSGSRTGSLEYSYTLKQFRLMTSGSITNSPLPLSPVELLDALNEDLEANVALPGFANSLAKKLAAAGQALTDDNVENDAAVLGTVYAFCESVKAQTTKLITYAESEALLGSAKAMVASLEGDEARCQPQ